MFDILKKKLSSFVSGLSEKLSAKPPGEADGAPKEAALPARAEAGEKTLIQPAVPRTEEQAVQKAAETPHAAEQRHDAPRMDDTTAPSAAPRANDARKPLPQASEPVVAAAQPARPAAPPEAPAVPKRVDETRATQPAAPHLPKGEEKRRDVSPDLGIFSKLKGIVTNRVEITDAETRGMFDELELALLESDVSPDTAQALVADLRARLVGRTVARGALKETVNAEVSGAICGVFSPAPDLVARVKSAVAQKKVFTIMFLGPNGAGKTTTIAKLAKRFKDEGVPVVIAASDTFRAAAIEQAGIHAERVGVRLVKQAYGADPAAVAFDAVRHAQAAGAGVVLIDTAGRQETNRNLIEEMKKIQRVVKPDAKIFIGEALAGHALVEQVKSFDAAVGVDGIILTKLDCDAKGGNSISIAHDSGKPILFFGVGQEYGDLVPFDSAFVARKVMEA